jgi:hypothetical protein
LMILLLSPPTIPEASEATKTAFAKQVRLPPGHNLVRWAFYDLSPEQRAECRSSNDILHYLDLAHGVPELPQSVQEGGGQENAASQDQKSLLTEPARAR